MKGVDLLCICYITTWLPVTYSHIGVQTQPFTEWAALGYKNAVVNSESHTANAASAAPDSGDTLPLLVKHGAPAARQQSLPPTLATIILHRDVCPADYTEAAALAATSAVAAAVYTNKHNTINKLPLRHFISTSRTRPTPALASFDLCLPFDKPGLLTGASTAASGNGSRYSELPDAGPLTKGGCGTDLAPVQTGGHTASMEQASLLQHMLHLLWAKQEFPLTIYLWAAIVATCSMFSGWVTYRILRIKKSASTSPKQNATGSALPNDAAVKEKQAAAGAAAGLSKQSSGISTKIYSSPATSSEATAFMQPSSSSLTSRRFTGAISIDQKQARNLAEEAAAVNSTSPATTKTSKAAPLDTIQETHETVSTADCNSKQQEQAVDKADPNPLKKSESAAQQSNSAHRLIADSSMGKASTIASAEPLNQVHVVHSNHFSLHQATVPNRTGSNNQVDVADSKQTLLLQQAATPHEVDSANRPARRRKASVLLPSAEQAQQAAAEEADAAAVQETAVSNMCAQDMHPHQGTANTSTLEVGSIPKHATPNMRVQEVPGWGSQQPSFTMPLTSVAQQPSFIAPVTFVPQKSSFTTPLISQRVPAAISQPLGSSRQNQVFGSFSSMGDSEVIIRMDVGTDAGADGADRRGVLCADKGIKKNKKKSKWYKRLLCCSKPAVK